MVAATEGSPISDYRISSVVPGTASGEHKEYELRNMDLAMKFHYIKAVYFFHAEAAQGLTSYDFKKHMFLLLDFYCQISGRIRKAENSKLYVKCNDAGVRIVEANCAVTIDEWFSINGYSLHQSLAYGNAIGPDLSFSPLVFIQLTWFKCGGVSVGISWAHLLGDAFSVSTFMNQLGQFMAGAHLPPTSLHLPMSESRDFPPSVNENPSSAKRIHTIGDCWMTANSCKMKTHSFYVSGKKIDQMVSMAFGVKSQDSSKISPFEIVSALVWKCLSQIREDLGPRTVTICTPGIRQKGNVQGCTNGTMLSTVQADFSVVKSEISELAKLIADKKLVENHSVQELVKGKDDFIVYGANLTFVNLEEANVYGLELKGRKPILATYSLDGVGDEGAVLVLPGPENDEDSDDGNGRLVTVILAEEQVERIKSELRNESVIA